MRIPQTAWTTADRTARSTRRGAAATLLAVVAAPWPTPAPAQAASPDAGVQATIAALEESLTAAFNTLDAATLDRLWDEEFVVVFPNGVRHDKRQRLAALKDRPAVIPQYRNESVQIRSLPGVAVALVVSSVITPGAERAEPTRLLTTRVWVERAGRWTILSAHLSALRN